MRKKLNKNIRKNVKGITLIALVVTIVILLILAGITLDLTIGSNSIITRSTEAAKKTKRAQVDDYLSMKMAAIQMDQYGSSEGQDVLQDIVQLVNDKKLVGINDIKISLPIPNGASESPISAGTKATVHGTIQNNGVYYSTELIATLPDDVGGLGDIENIKPEISYGDLVETKTLEPTDKIMCEALKSMMNEETQETDEFKIIPITAGELSSSILDLPSVAILDKRSNLYYESSVSLGINSTTNIINAEIKLADVNLQPMKIKVNSGDDSTVGIPMLYFKGTIDWGDGTVDDGDSMNYRMVSKLNKGKIASIEEVLPKMALVSEEEVGLFTHTYADKNKEYSVTINGFCGIFSSSRIGRVESLSDDGEDTDDTGDTQEENPYIDFEKITSIDDFGSLGANSINFTNCDQLTNIAEPRDNSFLFVNSFEGSFANCTALEEIPSTLFKNTNALSFIAAFMNDNKLKSIPADLFSNLKFVVGYQGTFFGCTGLTGNAPELWKNVITIHRQSDTKLQIVDSYDEEEDMQIPDGEECFAQCLDLDNYDDIPMYWKQLPEK